MSATRFYVGLDLGKKQDSTAMAVVEDVGNELHVRYLARLPIGQSYTTIIDWVKSKLVQQPLLGNSTLVVDASGVGGPMVDYMVEAKLPCPLTTIVITAAGVAREVDRNAWHVSRTDLLQNLKLLVEQKKLWVTRHSSEAQQLEEELAGLRLKFKDRGRSSIEAKGGGGHDDLAMAVSMACWATKHVSRKASIGFRGAPLLG